MDNNATFRRLKFTGLLLRSQWVIKLCSKGGIQMKKTLKKKEHKGRNNVSVYAHAFLRVGLPMFRKLRRRISYTQVYLDLMLITKM